MKFSERLSEKPDFRKKQNYLIRPLTLVKDFYSRSSIWYVRKVFRKTNIFLPPDTQTTLEVQIFQLLQNFEEML